MTMPSQGLYKWLCFYPWIKPISSYKIYKSLRIICIIGIHIGYHWGRHVGLMDHLVGAHHGLRHHSANYLHFLGEPPATTATTTTTTNNSCVSLPPVSSPAPLFFFCFLFFIRSMLAHLGICNQKSGWTLRGNIYISTSKTTPKNG